MRRKTKSIDGRHNAVQDNFPAPKEEEGTYGVTIDELRGDLCCQNEIPRRMNGRVIILATVISVAILL